jgi:hypothetical protein
MREVEQYHLVREVIRKPRNTDSSRIGARIPVTAINAAVLSNTIKPHNRINKSDFHNRPSLFMSCYVK